MFVLLAVQIYPTIITEVPNSSTQLFNSLKDSYKTTSWNNLVKVKRSPTTGRGGPRGSR